VVAAAAHGTGIGLGHRAAVVERASGQIETASTAGVNHRRIDLQRGLGRDDQNSGNPAVGKKVRLGRAAILQVVIVALLSRETGGMGNGLSYTSGLGVAFS
jgi:hypothetical protein